MEIGRYTDIKIHSDNRFAIVSSECKPSTALKTLHCIEKVLREGFIYSGALKEYSTLTPSQLTSQLKSVAMSIRDGYMEKSRQACFFARFFGRLAQKEQEVQIAYARVETLISDLPNDMLLHIAKFLPVRDFIALSQMNSRYHTSFLFSPIEVEEAREYGYRGNDVAESREFLKTLFQTIKALIKDGCIRGAAYRNKWIPDIGATLKRVQKGIAQVFWNEAILHYIGMQSFTVVKGLLELGANVEAKNEKGSTPLMAASAEGYLPIVQLLIQKRANVNAIQRIDGGTPLIFAVLGTNKEVVKLLLANGAQATINHIDSYGNSALHYARVRDCPGIVQLLLAYGAHQ